MTEPCGERVEDLDAHEPVMIERAVHLAANAMFVARRDGRIAWINAAFTRLYGYTADEVVGRTPSLLKSGRQTSAFYRELWSTIQAGRVWRGYLGNRHKDGRVFDVEQTITPICGEDGEVRSFFVVYEDVTERLRSERQMARLALFDGVTGLPNRHQFDERLRQAAARSRRSGMPIAVLAVNLDRFREINERLGHQAGDEVLQQMGRTLLGVLRDTDLVARHSGDQFTVLIEDLRQPEQAIEFAQRLMEALASPLDLLGQPVQVSCSIGIAVSGAVDVAPDQLLGNADLALLQAKVRGRGQFQFFDAAMDTSARKRHAADVAFRRALREERLHLRYQPQVEMASGRVVGAEALLRWHDDDRRTWSAAEFVALAEQNGMIFTINDWVLSTAVADIAAMHRREPSLPPIAVNVSAAQFERVGLAVQVQELLQKHGVPARLLRLEITETVMLRPSLTVHENLRALARLGVLISIDDFGTGYSSLPALREFPVQGIKLDISYVRNIGISRRDEQMLRAIVRMASQLDLDVTAEGVETEAQRDFLLKEGCRSAQGWLYARDLSPEELASMAGGSIGKASDALHARRG